MHVFDDSGSLVQFVLVFLNYYTAISRESKVTHTYTHTHTETVTHAHTHTHTHIHREEKSNTCTHMHAHGHTHRKSNTCTHARTHSTKMNLHTVLFTFVTFDFKSFLP